MLFLLSPDVVRVDGPPVLFTVDVSGLIGLGLLLLALLVAGVVFGVAALRDAFVRWRRNRDRRMIRELQRKADAEESPWAREDR